MKSSLLCLRWYLRYPLSHRNLEEMMAERRLQPDIRRKKRVVASQWFRSVDGALSTIAGYEAMNIIRKGQIRWLSKTAILSQPQFIARTLGIAA